MTDGVLGLKIFQSALARHHVFIRTDTKQLTCRDSLTSPVKIISFFAALEQCSLSVTQSCSRARSLELRHRSCLQGGTPCKRMEAAPGGGCSDLEAFWQGKGSLFASREKTYCPLFFSLTDCSAPLGVCMGVNVFTYSCPATLFPSVDVILHILERVRQHGLSLIPVVPRWPAKPWYA